MHEVHWATILTTAGSVLAVVVAVAALAVSIKANAHAAASARAAKMSAQAAEETNRRDAARRLDEMAPKLTATAEWAKDIPGLVRALGQPSLDSLVVTVRNKSNRDYQARGILRQEYGSSPGKEISFQLSAFGTSEIDMGSKYTRGLQRPEPLGPLYDTLFIELGTAEATGSWKRAFRISVRSKLLDMNERPVENPVEMTAIPYDFLRPPPRPWRSGA